MSILKYGDAAARKVSERIGAYAADATALAALPSDGIITGMVVLKADDGSLWRYSGTAWLPITSATVAQVRGAVIANIADLTAFTVASNDGLTYAAGELVLLANQTNTSGSECGIYKVGTVASTTAPLTRVDQFASGLSIKNGMTVEVSEGTLWKGSTWKAFCTGAKVWGTDDPVFYPRNVRGTLTLASGTKALGATEGLFLLSTTRSTINVTFNTAGGTKTGTVGFGCTTASRTAGKSGTAAATVIACVEAGTIQNQDNSTLDFLVTNW